MADAPDRLVEALSGSYRIERELGSGGMAVVYLAEDLKHGRPVAIKVLRPDLSYELGVDRFLREIRIAAGLSHPNILPLFDSGDANGLLYFVMPYIEGETLRQRLRRERRLTVDDTVRIVGEIGDALARAHEAGVVHRDVKPENILLEGGHALVTDFGVAWAIDAAGGERLTRTGMAVGTPHYMSPEQVTNESAVDHRSDVYALGCVAYEMLAGEPPFKGSSAPAVVAAHLSKEVDPLADRGAHVPDGVERAIRRALAKEPDDRFETTTEMVEALRGAMTADAVRADRRRAARRRWSVRAAAVAALAALSAGAWWLNGALARPSIERLAVMPASNFTRDPANDAFVDGVHEALVHELQRAGIGVVARQSVLQFRGSDLPSREIAAQLGVDGLLQPVVAREGGRVEVDVTLIDGRTELSIWNGTFESDVSSVLGLYRDVSRRVADELGVVLTAGTVARLAARPTVDPQVLEAVYAGQFHLRGFNPQDFALALGYFDEALERDSLSAAAHIGIAMVWGYRAQGGLVPMAEARPMMDRHTARALEIDPEVDRALFVDAAREVWGDWDVEEGERKMRAELARDSLDAVTTVFYGHVLMILGRFDEALAYGRRAMALDPLSPFVAALHAAILANTGGTAEAIALLEDVHARSPGAGFGRAILVELLEAEGRLDESLAVRRGLEALYPGVADALDAGYAAGGYQEATRRAADQMARLVTQGIFVGPMRIAQLYLSAGDADSALAWYERAVEIRDPNVPYLGVAEAARPLHGRPRFQALLERVGVAAHLPAERE
jgi:serine/threonine-protein kinase